MDDTKDLSDLDGRELVELLHPINEASREHIVKAADEIGQLFRWLNHATLPERFDKTLPYPRSVDDLVKDLKYGLDRLPQLLNQVAARLTRLQNHAQLATDSPNDGITAQQRAHDAADALHYAAAEATALAETMSTVRRNTSHLKFDLTEALEVQPCLHCGRDISQDDDGVWRHFGTAGGSFAECTVDGQVATPRM